MEVTQKMETEQHTVTYRALDQATTRQLKWLVRHHNPHDIARSIKMDPRTLYRGLLEVMLPVEQADRLTARLTMFERGVERASSAACAAE
jgi:hypothetical protein